MLTICRVFGVCVAVALLPDTARSIAEDPRQEIDSANIIEKFNAAEDGVGHLLLPIKIHKKKYFFILDTGSADVVYDVSFRSILGKPKKIIKGSTDAGNIELKSFDSPEAFLGKLSLKTVSDVAACDLSRPREWTGCDFYGVIGMSFLKNHVVRIDFDKGEVLFLKSSGCNPGRAFRLSYKGGVPYTEIIILECEQREKFIIDTGSDTNISGDIRLNFYKLLARNHIAKSLTGSHQKITLPGETVTNTDFRLNALSLGPFTHRNLIFSTSPKCDNMLGLGYLSRYIVTFDFPHQIMYLQKGKMFDLPDVKDRSGLSISRHAGKTVVTRVAWFSPAWRSGIRRQDIILKIEKNCADQTSLYSLRRLLGMEGKKVHLVLQRGQERIEVSLILG